MNSISEKIKDITKLDNAKEEAHITSKHLPTNSPFVNLHK